MAMFHNAPPPGGLGKTILDTAIIADRKEGNPVEIVLEYATKPILHVGEWAEFESEFKKATHKIKQEYPEMFK